MGNLFENSWPLIVSIPGHEVDLNPSKMPTRENLAGKTSKLLHYHEISLDLNSYIQLPRDKTPFSFHPPLISSPRLLLLELSEVSLSY